MPATQSAPKKPQPHSPTRRLPIGAEVQPSGGTHFRVWAPNHPLVELVCESPSLTAKLTAEGNGYHSALIPEAKAGTLYRFRLDGADTLYPDPTSRFQPQGPHGPSQVIDPAAFHWTDANWKGITAAGQVLYEMHFGTFTKEGTYAAAAKQLPHLKDTGITCLEVMPVADFSGDFGWGYDGVDLFAPTRLYGSPDDFRAFVDQAHALGIAVILDLVYNHLGPDGNYLPAFSPDYFNAEHKTDWGDAINFDGPNNAPVREFYLANARYWIDEFHVDGYRFDATQAIVDTSPKHILAEITEHAREAAGRRSIYLINENEPQHTQLVRPIDKGGYGMDGLWNDDFHHAAMVALTGRNEAYFTDYLGRPQEFVSAAKYGYLYQGQRYKWQKKRRGTPGLDLPPCAYVNFIQNHDQIANYGAALRAHQLTSPAQYRAMTGLLLLSPQTPMLFQGQEFCASSEFHYFAHHNAELNKMIKAGRAREMSQFPSVATPDMQERLLEPSARDTFERSKIDHEERTKPFHARMLEMHKDLLRLRREEAVFKRVCKRGDVDGAVVGPDAFVLRFFGDAAEQKESPAAPPRDTSPAQQPSPPENPYNPAACTDRLLVVNFGTDLLLDICPEPLMAPPTAATGPSSGPAKTPATAASAPPPSTPNSKAGSSPAAPPSSSPPSTPPKPTSKPASAPPAPPKPPSKRKNLRILSDRRLPTLPPLPVLRGRARVGASSDF